MSAASPMRALGLAVLLAICAYPIAGNTADAPQAVLDGLVQHAVTITPETLKAGPPSTVHISYLTRNGPEEADFAGVSLWDLLNHAGFGEAAGDRKARARHYLVVTGRDGYQVVIALGEIDPDFEGKTALIAISRNDAPLPPRDGLRLVVPGDKHGGRAVYDVAHIELK
jgi:hypothetical protein